jgi:diacylglycerol kinase (ATP)
MMLNKKYLFLSLLLIVLVGVRYFFTIQHTPSDLSETPKKQIALIVNPISGGVDKEKLIDTIKEKLDQSQFDIQVLYTNAPQHATFLARQAVNKKIDVVAIVGGDGSVNEVGEALIGSQTALAIIPSGSGNGIARHLQIPLETNEAVQLINQGHTRTIDTVLVNNRHYLGVAGIGFDAEISWEFDQYGHRGFISYLLLTLKKLPSYRPQKYQLIIDGKEVNQRAFLICFANTSQFGNGAFIAPRAKIDDGLLEVVIIKKFPFYVAPRIAHQLFHHSLNDSEYVESLSCKEAILNQKNIRAHIDGEPVLFENGLHIKVVPTSLKVIIP